MKRIPVIIISILGVALTSLCFIKKEAKRIEASKILSYEINPANQNLRFFWKNEKGENYVNFQNLKLDLEKENKELVFAMNGGMFDKQLAPKGLYIENGKILAQIDTLQEGYGNFYLQPNGMFYLTNENEPIICSTSDFIQTENIKYATQSGPMLLINGKMHSAFNEGSTNIHIRNGVGILPNGNLLFAMSKERINFFDFASFFKQNGCENALYLDGFVSKTYLPVQYFEQLDGSFGVIIAEIISD